MNLLFFHVRADEVLPRAAAHLLATSQHFLLSPFAGCCQNQTFL